MEHKMCTEQWNTKCVESNGTQNVYRATEHNMCREQWNTKCVESNGTQNV